MVLRRACTSDEDTTSRAKRRFANRTQRRTVSKCIDTPIPKKMSLVARQEAQSPHLPCLHRSSCRAVRDLYRTQFPRAFVSVPFVSAPMSMESDAVASATIELLEARLRRLAYLLTGATAWTGVPTTPEKPASLDETVSRRLARLERELEKLSRHVPAVRDVIQLRMSGPIHLFTYHLTSSTPSNLYLNAKDLPKYPKSNSNCVTNICNPI